MVKPFAWPIDSISFTTRRSPPRMATSVAKAIPADGTGQEEASAHSTGPNAIRQAAISQCLYCGWGSLVVVFAAAATSWAAGPLDAPSQPLEASLSIGTHGAEEMFSGRLQMKMKKMEPHEEARGGEAVARLWQQQRPRVRRRPSAAALLEAGVAEARKELVKFGAVSARLVVEVGFVVVGSKSSGAKPPWRPSSPICSSGLPLARRSGVLLSSAASSSCRIVLGRASLRLGLLPRHLHSSQRIQCVPLKPHTHACRYLVFIFIAEGERSGG
jgi:hypothetical protein